LDTSHWTSESTHPYGDQLLKCPVCPPGASVESTYMHLGPVAVLQNTDTIHISYEDRAPKLRTTMIPTGHGYVVPKFRCVSSANVATVST